MPSTAAVVSSEASQPCKVQGGGLSLSLSLSLSLPFRWRTLSQSEDKRATTNVQNGLVFFFLFSLLFSCRLFELKQ